MGLRDRFKSAFHGVGLKTDDAGVFSRTQWRLPWMFWCIYRLLFALYYASFIAFDFIFNFKHHPLSAAYFFIYLTDWTVLVVTIYMVVSCINVIIDRKHGCYYHTSNRKAPPALSWRHKLHWLLLNIYMNISILVTIVYWSFLHSPYSSLYYDLTEHTFPSILGLLDVILTPIPVRLIHFVYPFTYGMSYMLFTVIYWAAGGTDPNGNSGIYPGFLDWDEPGTTTLHVVLCGVAICLTQVFLWGLFKIKMAVFRRTVSSSHHERMDDAHDDDNGNSETNQENNKSNSFETYIEY
ncbi:protein rolling stone-like [Amphiura filiformis]|uniref:protein rolling stone-like n=1 Tax=Amphiura filiformis TaxID=82378 RepID=UPI003B20C959